MNIGSSLRLFISGLSLLILATGCDGPEATPDAGSPVEDAAAQPPDGGDPPADAAQDAGPRPPAPSGLPEGDSTWRGEIEASGVMLPVELSLSNDAGDLTGVVVAEFVGTYSLSGTYEPSSLRVALAPGDWIGEPTIDTELFGFEGVYDPEVGALTGRTADYASGRDNAFAGGPAELAFVEGAGTPTAAGSRDRALPEETLSFSGTFQCRGPIRETSGEITFDGAGGVTGQIAFGDPTFAEATATFAFTGVHNPSTGGVTLVPGLFEDTDHTYAAFFVESTYDPEARTLVGELRQNIGACPAERWRVDL